MAERDQNRLLESARRFAQELRSRKTPNLRLKKNMEANRTENGGWSVPIASWPKHANISVSLDRYLAKQQRHFWFGFWSTSGARITALTAAVPTELKPDKVFDMNSAARIGGDYILRKTPSDTALSRPVAEYYDAVENDFGMYDLGETLDVDRAVTFVASVIDAVENDASDPSLDIRRLLQRGDATVTQRLIDARLGQGRFREDLMTRWDGRCAVTGCSSKAVLRASHIKSWKDSDDDERLDPDNGILLSANLDALFDKHLISFQDSGEMLVSDQLLSTNDIKLLGIPDNLKGTITASQRRYLKDHRTKHLSKMRDASRSTP